MVLVAPLLKPLAWLPEAYRARTHSSPAPAPGLKGTHWPALPAPARGCSLSPEDTELFAFLPGQLLLKPTVNKASSEKSFLPPV